MLHLGPFHLEGVIGRGGMGEVWKGRHTEEGLPVAVKVVTTEAARNASALDAFRQEIRAVAGLEHPSIISVFDHGEIDAVTAEDSRGQLALGSPYLVMEYATHGSLSGVARQLDWRGCRRLLLALLDALAHAHARGVVHRDIKAENVLLTEATTGAALKLSDFGLAHALGRAEGSGGLVGTPVGMAPEQFRGAWREFGPWTDLYAVGVLAWELVTYRPPFEKEGVQALMQAHLLQDPPRLEPAISVPEGLESWLRRLLQKRSWDRYQRAADAAWELADLPEPPDGPPPAVPVRAPRPQALTWVEIDWDRPPPELDEPTALEQPLAPRRVPPLPQDWRRPGQRGDPVFGAGLGLYGLRTVPFVGREAERDMAWRLLEECRSARSPRALILRGPSGIGKSRLAAWISERANELGNATVLRADHDPVGGPRFGIARMLARHLHAVGLSGDDLEAHLEVALRGRGLGDPSSEVDGLVALLRPSHARLRLGSTTERYVLVQRVLQRAAADLVDEGGPRPVIVHLDDVQWGPDALSLARWLMSRGLEMPLMLILTIRDEAILERPEAALLLEQLELSEQTRVLSLRKLADAEHRELVRGLLGLSGELADEVEERTAGSPLFAVQLVGDLVHRGVLELSEQGWRLRSGERATIPDDLYEVWSARLDAALSERGPEDRRLLELAAALGHQVDADEWAVLCGHDDRPDVLEALARVRLLVRGDEGFAFVHGMLREALQRTADEEGRLDRHHRRCAAMLTERYGAKGEAVERIARHYLAAGDHDAALEPLAVAAERLRDAGCFSEARDLLDRRLAAQRTLGLTERDPRVAEGLVVRAAVDRMQGKWADFDERISRVLPIARQNGQIGVLAEAIRGVAEANRQRGLLEDARQGYLEALALYRRFVEDLLGEAHCILGLGDVCRMLHETESAREYYLLAEQLYSEIGDEKGVAGAHRGLGILLRHSGDFDGAATWIRRALAVYERIGARLGVANSLNDLGDFARHVEDFSKAEGLYLRSEAVYEACGSYAKVYPQTNLALLALQRGHTDEARKRTVLVLGYARARGVRGLFGVLHVVLAAAEAHSGRWSAFDRAIDQAIADFESWGDLDYDNAWPAELAGDEARRCGQLARARKAYGIALEQWLGLEQGARVRRLRRVLQQLEEG